MEEEIYIGTLKKGKYAGEKLSLSKHSWDCGWYWGFGYLGNSHLHTHFDGVFLNDSNNATEIFEDSLFSNKEWWVIRDLFIQAYSLQKCSEVYHYGGHQTTLKGTTDIINDPKMCERLNKDLEKVLNKIWEIVTSDRKKVSEKRERLKKLKDKLKEQIKIEKENSKINDIEKEIRIIERDLE